MEAVSEVILRNAASLGDDAVLLVDPPADGLTRRLLANGCSLAVSTQDHRVFRHQREASMGGGTAVLFEAAPSVVAGVATVILRLPREKARLRMVLHAIAAALAPDARLWLVGENRAGIKSCPRQLEPFFGKVAKLDNARHCGLYEAREPRPAGPFTLEEYETPWSVTFAGSSLRLRSLPGVFAHGRLDHGTRALLEVTEERRPAGRILDFACGSGVLGLALLKAGMASSVDLLDVSALAMESCRRSLAVNGLAAQTIAADGLSGATGRYDWIVSNPPFHRGTGQELDTAAAFFRNAGTFLTQRGRILVVFNRHLPYSHWLDSHFRVVDTLVAGRDYRIIQASEPR